ncbi:hypothetical protein ST201phi2-1p389 [Pseudomonas phage 201phi2-1]|uniref:Uncharacterized protein n=1 Tax=Pseudomonas phage 201phi2-1 TaxID=198110 RepID=B3FJP9_BP201|nr:hypothetical protein ST201phi2-1p389 [Pseudomonas phage 201phi2-1]ABY63214.1 hypothetical protein 201phi2-1p389 [Pseudomonas phage 201phi2-1]
MQLTNTVTAWTNQLHHALGNKIEEMIVADLPSFEADEELRGFFDQTYLDLYQHEACPKVRAEVIAVIQVHDHKLCRIQMH